MLQVTGIVAIPSEPNINLSPIQGGGTFLNFDVVSADPQDPTNPEKLHKYRATIFLKDDEVKEWKKLIVPGSVFWIAGQSGWVAKVSQTSKEKDKKYPMNMLKLDRFNFRPMERPYWLKGE